MKRIINTSKAPAAIGPYSQAVEVNGTLYISGQLPVNPASGKIEAANVSEQAEQVFANISVILTEAGYNFADVVKSTVFLAEMTDFPSLNAVYGKYYTENCPARSTIAVKALPLGALVEIETIAVKS